MQKFLSIKTRQQYFPFYLSKNKGRRYPI